MLSGQTTWLSWLTGECYESGITAYHPSGRSHCHCHGLRTPFARQATAFHGVPAIDLGKMVVGEMLARSDIPAEVIEQLVFGRGADAGSAEHRPGNCAGYRHERTYRRL